MFARAGCTSLAITDLNAGTLESTARAIREINPEARVTQSAGDVSNEDFVNGFVDGAVKALGRVDYAVNCAGIQGDALRSSEIPAAQFDRINGVNYRGSWLVSRAVLAHMVKRDPLPEQAQQRGAIVNIASQLGIVGRPEAGEFFPRRHEKTDRHLSCSGTW